MRRVVRDVRGIGQEVTESLKALGDRMHDANNKAIVQMELLYEQSEYASQIDERTTALEQAVADLASRVAALEHARGSDGPGATP